jgi:hypothetical protein
VSTYRLRYDPETALGHKYASIRYPRQSLPGIPTRGRAEQALAAMPNGADMLIEEED